MGGIISPESLYSAREYLEEFWPELLDVFLDQEQALQEETTWAAGVAEVLGISAVIDESGVTRYPRKVWDLLE